MIPLHPSSSSSSSTKALAATTPATVAAASNQNKSYLMNNINIGFNIEIMTRNHFTDISNLPDNTYGVPLFTENHNFDAIIQPDTIIQYMTTVKHKGDSNELDIIRNMLNDKITNHHKIIFVVPQNNLNKFKYQKNLSNVNQFVITDIPLPQPLPQPLPRHFKQHQVALDVARAPVVNNLFYKNEIKENKIKQN